MSDHIGDANKMVDTPRTDAAKGEGRWANCVDVDFARTLERELAAVNSELSRLKFLFAKSNEDISQICGKALGYPRFCDDQANFPGATEKEGVFVGEHVAETIVEELSGALTKANARVKELEEKLKQAESEITFWQNYP